MDTIQIILIIAAIVIAVAVGAWFVIRRRRQDELRRRFGPEYDRLVAERGAGAAEKEVLARESRVQELDLRPLPAEESVRVSEAWRSLQTLFVDDPVSAVKRADLLVDDVITALGYPASDFEQRAGDLSVRHARSVRDYRAGHEIVRRSDEPDTTTEELRRAMTHYRTLLTDLVGDSFAANGDGPEEAPADDPARTGRQR